MRDYSHSHVAAAAAGVVLTVLAGGGVLFASGEAASDHHARAGVSASTLDHRRANQLTRVTSTQSTKELSFRTPRGCTFEDIQRLRVKNLHDGYLLVTGTVGAAESAFFPGPDELVARLKVGSKLSGTSGTQLVTTGEYDGNITVQGVFPVTQGTSLIRLRASSSCETHTSGAFITNRTITALFVPFGSTKVAVPARNAHRSASNR